MSDASDIPGPEWIVGAYRDKAHAEIGSADTVSLGLDYVQTSGDPLAWVTLVKGEPGPAEISGGAALSGEDGRAALKALSALGFDAESVFAVVSRPVEADDPDMRARRLALLLEVVDSPYVVGLDAAAADDLAVAMGVSELAFGSAYRIGGRTIVCVDGLEASLGEERSKRRTWNQMRALAPSGPVW